MKEMGLGRNDQCELRLDKMLPAGFLPRTPGGAAGEHPARLLQGAVGRVSVVARRTLGNPFLICGDPTSKGTFVVLEGGEVTRKKR